MYCSLKCVGKVNERSNYSEDKSQKYCTACKKNKPVDRFKLRTGQAVHFSRCRDCDAVAYQKWYGVDGRNYHKDWKNNVRATNPAQGMFNAAKRRAKENGLPFNIEIEDIVIPEFCPALGIKLEVQKVILGPNSPSLDKMIPSLGYVKGNVAVISHRANRIKFDATEEELEGILAWMRSRNKEPSH